MIICNSKTKLAKKIIGCMFVVGCTINSASATPKVLRFAEGCVSLTRLSAAYNFKNTEISTLGFQARTYSQKHVLPTDEANKVIIKTLMYEIHPYVSIENLISKLRNQGVSETDIDVVNQLYKVNSKDKFKNEIEMPLPNTGC